MRIGFVGAGKVGCAFGKFLRMHGVDVAGYASQRMESAREAAAFTETRAYESPQALLADCDALFITVPDGKIRAVYESLDADQLAGKMICHCSGALSAGETFPGIEEAGAYGYSIHPLFPVSGRDVWSELVHASFSIEGSARYLQDWEQLLRDCGVAVRVIEPAAKTKYHAACCIAANLMCALADEATGLLGECGFAPEEARSALAPLMRANLESIIAVGAEAALTGPVERNDIGTVARHLGCLETEEERELYCAASAHLVGVARHRHPEQDYQPMEELLGMGSAGR